MPRQPIRVAVIGVGHVGSLHAQVYAKLPGARLVAVCDTNAARARQIAAQLGCRAVPDVRALTGLVEAASVAVPTNSHYALGRQLLEAGIHVLMEKPIASTLPEADQLLRLSRRTRRILQVGHIERFNAAVQAAKAYLTHPRFIEVHRLSPYPFRGLDVSVILDVMIHDLDLILALVPSQPVRVEAVGVPVLSPSEDIANVRLVFASGCVANLTASRISDETMRRIRLFQEDCYLSIDARHQTVEIARKIGRHIRRRTLTVTPRPPLNEEPAAFLKAVAMNRRSRLPAAPTPSGHAGVSGEEAREALALALRIERAMRAGQKPDAQSVVHRP
jgi:predicted dehydrogenase